MLNIKVNKKNGIPLYVQIREALRAKITNGGLKSDRLPTERELAERLHVSRNTVSSAYRELEDDGLINTHVGKGTFVAGDGGLSRQDRQVLLGKAIGQAVEESLSLGFTLDEFQDSADGYVESKRRLLKGRSVAFIECNNAQLRYFAEHLKIDERIRIEPVLLQDLKDPAVRRKVEQADLVVTSFYHYAEIHTQLVNRRDRIMGIGLRPEMRTLVEIARLQEDSVVGIMISSEEFYAEVYQTLIHSEIKFKDILRTTSKDPEEMKVFIKRADAVITSPTRYAAVRKAAGRRKKIIEFIYTPDEASTNNLNIMLLENKGNI
ncbi:GntR family transcriptional regulator [Planctomycetota bacterium]